MSQLTLLDPVFGNSFDTALRRFFSPLALEAETPPLKMRIDVTENDKAFTVKADLPGVKKEDINVKVTGNVVSIDASVQSEKETPEKGSKVLRSERYFGTISRAFSLGQEVDDKRVQAKYAEGVLTLELPKKVATEPSKILIQ